ncbi:SidA/IucD/PvdA family monooxygenase [Salmonella enterica]|nr:SidA/IucD/PvdA family monooxygenase [Salmonella enterica]
MTSDGINPETLEEIYKFLYKNKLMNRNKIEVNFYMSSEAIFGNSTKYNVNVIVKSNITKSESAITVDATILCTGYVQNKTPDILKELNLSTSNYDGFIYQNDYSVKENKNGKIYLINAGVNHFGISDPNISLCAWRSSVIVNSIFGQEIYKTPQYMDSILC